MKPSTLDANKSKNVLLDPEDPFWGDRYTLSELENKSLDPEWAKANPELAALNYPGFSATQKSRRANSGPTHIFNNFLKPYVLNPLSKGVDYTTKLGPLGSAAAVGGVGFIGGSVLDTILNKFGVNSKLGLLLGLLGAGTGYYRTNYKNSNYLNMQKQTEFYKLGKAIGFSTLNVPVSEGFSLSYKEDTLKNASTQGYGIMQKNVCKLVSDMYSLTDQKHKFEYHVFSKLAHAKRWSEDLDPYVDTVYETLSHLNARNKLDLNQVVKSAVFNFFKFGGMAPNVVKGLLALSAATGGSVGALSWYLNRHSTEDTSKNEALKQKINYYNLITDELSNQLKAKGLLVSEEDPELKNKQLV